MKEASDLTTKSQRNSLVGRPRELPELQAERDDADPEPIETYGYRSFDRQFIIADARVITYPRQDLWNVLSFKQFFLTTLTSTTLGAGPVLTATPYVPDLHHFKNRGAKDVFPMWRDAEAIDPNLGPVVLERLQGELGTDIGPDEVVKYLYGLGGTAAYSSRFRKELAVAAGPVRLPITKKRELFNRAVALGEELLAWHTWGERFTTAPLELGPAREVIAITGRPDDFGFDPVTQILRVGSGTIQPVSTEVWDFEVSGMKPLQKWLGYRMAKRRGRTSSPLDDITYDRWSFTEELLFVISILQRTVDLTPHAADLLDQIIAGPLFVAEELA